MCFVSAYASKRMGMRTAKYLLGVHFVHETALCVCVCVSTNWGLAEGVHMGEGGSSWAPGL